MVIKFIPSPDIKMVFKSFVSRNSYEKLCKDTNTSFYSRGTWALYSGIIKSLELKEKRNGIVLFPDYFCNEVLIPLRDKGICINFYPVDKNLEPDWKYIEKKLGNGCSADVFVLVHYFGFVSSLKKASNICKKYNMLLIEDGAHVLSRKNINEANFSIYSPRKVLALPEIGILVSKTSKTKLKFNRNSFIFIKWLCKNFAQYFFSKLNFNWHTFNLSNKTNNIVSINNERHPSIYSLRLFCLYENEISIYERKRIENYLKIEKSIKTITNVYPLFNKLPKNITPYVFPLIIKKNISDIKNKLIKDGIPVSSWPDLPSEVIESFSDHQDAIWTNKHLLLFPIHHKLKNSEIEYIISSINKNSNL